MGVVSLPSERSTRFGNPAWPGGRTANFAAFEPWPEVLSKNAESLRDSDALMRVAVPQALCVLQECLRPRPKSGKVRRSDTRPGDVCERAERSEGSNSAPSETAPVSPCDPLCAIL